MAETAAVNGPPHPLRAGRRAASPRRRLSLRRRVEERRRVGCHRRRRRPPNTRVNEGAKNRRSTFSGWKPRERPVACARCPPTRGTPTPIANARSFDDMMSRVYLVCVSDENAEYELRWKKNEEKIVFNYKKCSHKVAG